MTTIWPATLPQRPLADSFEERWGATVLRTQMDTGAAKQRPRYSAAVEPLQVSYRMTPAQVETLRAFVRDTLAGGALPFEMTHPRTGATVTVRIVAGPDGPVTLRPWQAGVRWIAALKLEILP